LGTLQRPLRIGHLGKFFLIIAVALSGAALTTGNADAAAFCAYAGGRAGYENCGYHTWEQCLLAVNGRGGQCMRNPHEPALWRLPFERAPRARKR
jgi:Protein of unknown function (DUF3551)